MACEAGLVSGLCFSSLGDLLGLSFPVREKGSGVIPRTLLSQPGHAGWGAHGLPAKSAPVWGLGAPVLGAGATSHRLAWTNPMQAPGFREWYWNGPFHFPVPADVIGLPYIHVWIPVKELGEEEGVEDGSETEHMSEGLWLQALWVKQTSGTWPSHSVRSP